jgi:methylmalonyl-CoA mutase
MCSLESMTESLINSPFTPAQLYNQVTLDNWRETAIKSLKGADFSVLEKISPDKINIQPLYSAVDVQSVYPIAPKATQTYGVWDIRQRLVVESEADANKIALSELEGGVNSIEFEFADANIDFAKLINGIKSDLATIGIIGYDNGIELANKLIAATPSDNLKDALFAFNLNPASLGLMGLDTYSIDDAIEFYLSNNVKLPKAKFFLASANWMLEIGASRALQVAILIASGLEWLREGEAKNIDANAINKALLFKIGIDGQVILEIAKLRAIRLLWAKIGASMGIELPMDLQAIVSGTMLEDLHPHTNILRIANACFAAGTGGANIISTRSFEPDPENESEFTRRIARNTQIVLANESNIARVDDPAAGSFAFEALTNDIAQKAWALIQSIEANGGLSAAMKAGLIGDYMNAEHFDTEEEA